MGRWIGIDYGTRRIGVAISDFGGSIASPAETLNATGTVPGDAVLVLQYAEKTDTDVLVVGLPLNMDGSDSDQTRLTRSFARALSSSSDLEVILWDERLSSFQADQLLDAAQVRKSRRKGLRDTIAAQVMLQSFLDARQIPPPPASELPYPED
ncbi:MAG: Holliday junction resolvase RuvX [Planctomycetota bacterium]